MPDQRRTCSDCDGALTAIQLIDKRGRGTGVVHGVLEDAVGEAKRSMCTGKFPVEGEVHAYMCGGCGRVLLYRAQVE